jgi:hypothetical protein
MAMLPSFTMFFLKHYNFYVLIDLLKSIMLFDVLTNFSFSTLKTNIQDIKEFKQWLKS